jgi:hypothetical protein
MEVRGQRYAPAALPPRKNPGAHVTGGWMGPKAVLDVLEKKCISCSSYTHTHTSFRCESHFYGRKADV